MTTLRSSFLRVLAAVAVALGLLVAVLPIAASADDLSWTVRTASNDYGKSRTSFAYAIDPGGSAKDGLVVANHGKEPLELGIYSSDGYTTSTGQLDLLTTDRQSIGIGAWVHASVAQITIAPGKEKTVGFTVSVPENASPGDYAGGIVTSLSSVNSAGITVERRLGIRITLRVGGELKPALAVEAVHVSWSGGLNPFAGGDATVAYTLHNTGNAIVGAQPSATLTGPFGWFATTANAAEAPPKLLPGESWTQTIQVPGVAASFLVFATLSVVPLVYDPSGSTSPLDPVTGSGMGLALPWMLLLLVVLAAGAVVAGWYLRKQRLAREEARVQEAVAAALAAAQTSSSEETAGTVSGS
jgi:hypothetical protein